MQGWLSVYFLVLALYRGPISISPLLPTSSTPCSQPLLVLINHLIQPSATFNPYSQLIQPPTPCQPTQLSATFDRPAHRRYIRGRCGKDGQLVLAGNRFQILRELDGRGAEAGKREVGSSPDEAKLAGVWTSPTPSSTPVEWKGSGGGFAGRFAMPTHQKKVVESYLSTAGGLPPSASFNQSNRAYPDIAAMG